MSAEVASGADVEAFLEELKFVALVANRRTGDEAREAMAAACGEEKRKEGKKEKKKKN